MENEKESTTSKDEVIARPLDVINENHILISKVDVSNSKVDTSFFLKREMLLYEPYKTSDDEDKVIDFFHASYGFRIAFSSLKDDRGSFALYPAGNYLMSSSPSADLNTDHSDSKKVTEIYSILFNVSLDEWKDITDTPEYKKFKVAKDGIKDVLGWDMSDYRTVEIPKSLTKTEQVTFDIAAGLWKKAKAL